MKNEKKVRIEEIRIKRVKTLSPMAQEEVSQKLKEKDEDFNFKGYASVSYILGSPLSVYSVDPIEGTILDVFDKVMEKISIEEEE